MGRDLGDDALDIKDSDDAKISTISFSTDDDRHCKIDLSARDGVVAWKDSDQQERYTSDLRIDLHVDTAEEQAMFALHGYILLKYNNLKTSLILLIHPEVIQSIEFARTRSPVPTTHEAHDHAYIALHFTLAQPPSLVTPKGAPLEAKKKYQAILNDMKSLGTARQFTVYLNILNLIPEAREQLALLPSIFPPAHPFGLMRTDETRASLDTLFRSGPGEVIDLGQTAVPAAAILGQTLVGKGEDTGLEEPIGPVPPPYPQAEASMPLQSPLRITPTGMSLSSLCFTRPQVATHLHPSNTYTEPPKKRRRLSDSLLSPSTPDYHRLLSAFRQVLKHHAGQEARIHQLETQLQSLAGGNRTPCRYNTEEKEDITTHLEDRIDDQMYSVHRDLEGAMLTETEERVEETVELKHAELRQEIEDEWIDDIRHDISAQLKQHIKKEIFRDMVRALVKTYKGDEAENESPRRKMSRKFGKGSPSTSTTASTQCTQSTQSTQSRVSATVSVSQKLRTTTASETLPSPPIPSMPGELPFQTAIEDIQKRYGGKVTAEEMMRVMDFLEANPMSAVKYNSCATDELKWLYVQRWTKATNE